jgi:hypothetical protein
MAKTTPLGTGSLVLVITETRLTEKMRLGAVLVFDEIVMEVTVPRRKPRPSRARLGPVSTGQSE